MRKFLSRVAVCITAVMMMIALCGCDDLGEYVDVEEYYASFGEVVLIDGITKESTNHLIKNCFYNESTRDDFLVDPSGNCDSVDHTNNYVYMAIPFKKTIDVDSVALYLQSTSEVTLYISVFVVSEVPSNWQAIADNVINEDGTPANADKTYDDPDPDTKIGEITIHLNKDKWNSFLLDKFSEGESVDGLSEDEAVKNSIQIRKDQILLLQIRNNSGARVFDETNQVFKDYETGLDLPVAEITMTNLLIRSLETDAANEAQGGE